MQVSAQLLPSGSTLPPLGSLVVLVVAVAVVAAALYRAAPRVTDRVVVSFAPWMVAGSSLYALLSVGGVPSILVPFVGSPAVYVSVAVVAGAVWAGATAVGLPADGAQLRSVPGVVGLAGVVVAVVIVVRALLVGAPTGLTPVWPAIGLVVAAVVSAVVWVGLCRLYPRVRVTGAVGALCVFGHALDGVSTAIGLDVLGFGERSPLSRVIIEFAAGLPTASVIGSGWLFVLAKLVLASGVVVLLSGYVRDEPTEGYLLLGAVAAVGLGPGAHNLLLFTIAS